MTTTDRARRARQTRAAGAMKNASAAPIAAPAITREPIEQAHLRAPKSIIAYLDGRRDAASVSRGELMMYYVTQLAQLEEHGRRWTARQTREWVEDVLRRADDPQALREWVLARRPTRTRTRTRAPAHARAHAESDPTP